MEDTQIIEQKITTQPIENIVQIDDEQMFTTSLIVAEAFEKNHFDVLKAIKNLECSPEFNKRNFAVVEYKDAKGEMRPAYRLTRDGFAFLAMGFTGKKAAAWKEKFLEAFNAMEAALLKRQQEEKAPLPQQEEAKTSFSKSLAFRSHRLISEQQRDALIGALHAEAYWQGCSFEEAQHRFLASMNLESLEDLEHYFWNDAVICLLRRFFLIRNKEEHQRSFEEASLALHGFIKFWRVTTRYYKEKDIQNYILNWCGISDLGAITTERDMLKAMFVLWGGFSKHALSDKYY